MDYYKFVVVVVVVLHHSTTTFLFCRPAVNGPSTHNGQPRVCPNALDWVWSELPCICPNALDWVWSELPCICPNALDWVWSKLPCICPNAVDWVWSEPPFSRASWPLTCSCRMEWSDNQKPLQVRTNWVSGSLGLIYARFLYWAHVSTGVVLWHFVFAK